MKRQWFYAMELLFISPRFFLFGDTGRFGWRQHAEVTRLLKSFRKKTKKSKSWAEAAGRKKWQLDLFEDKEVKNKDE